MSYLIVRRGPNQGKIYPLTADEIRVGRGSKNDIIIDDNDVSRDHLHFVRVVGGYELHDLSSDNGTFVNGQNVEGIWLLRSHCIIELGDSITLEYRLGDPVEEDYIQDGDAPAGFSSRTQYYFIVTTDTQNDPSVYPLIGEQINVGRSTSNDVVIVEPELSRNHFRLTLTSQGYMIEDVGSTNGTLVNDEFIEEPRLLYTGDLITIGMRVYIQLTNSPEKYVKDIQTDLLFDRTGRTDGKRKRKTSEAEVAGVAGMLQSTPEPTDIGTGVDHVSLENQVLITYARDDWEKIVAPLVDRLYVAEIETWVDQYLIENSNDWLVATEQARMECWLLVVVVSPKAMRSGLVRKNWHHFHNREKPIILVIHEPVDRLPIGAKKLVRIQYNPGLPDIAFQQLIGEIKRLQG